MKFLLKCLIAIGVMLLSLTLGVVRLLVDSALFFCASIIPLYLIFSAIAGHFLTITTYDRELYTIILGVVSLAKISVLAIDSGAAYLQKRYTNKFART